MAQKIVIGSRGSDLALWQANHIQDRLKSLGCEVELIIIKTQGDQIQNMSFDKLEGKGFFTKELEDALLNKTIDLAVHSHKDLPTTNPEGLIIAAVSEREDPSELMLIRKECVDITQQFSLKKGAIVGTSSARRKSQLLGFRPDVQLADIRGNVPTRVQKLRDGKYDAILLANAGVTRLALNLSDLHTERISPTHFIPAPAQGVLALQTREADTELFATLQAINNKEVAEAISIERKVLNLFDGGCQLPLGVYCHKENDKFRVWSSRATNWDAFPKRIYRENATIEGIAEDIVKAHLLPASLSVFITRNLNSDDYINRSLNAMGYQVKGQSLIKTNMVPFSSAPQTDWIFFSSKNGVKYFFEQQPEIDPKTKFAVLGKGTERVLRSLGKVPSFVGDDVNTAIIGKEFHSHLAEGSVLFPGAHESLKAIQNQIAFSNKSYDLVVYRTEAIETPIPEADIIIFTSPSNVDSFFMNGGNTTNKQVIAIGPSTGKALEIKGLKSYIIPYSPDEVGLAEAVFSIN